MEVKAKAKYLKISSKKVIPVVNLVRGKKAEEVEELLRALPKKSASLVLKLVNSALSNAKNNYALNTKNLYISEIQASPGPVLKRVKFRARGRRDIIKKRTCHLFLTLSEKDESVLKVGRETERVKKPEKPKVLEKIEKPKGAELSKGKLSFPKEAEKPKEKKKKKVEKVKPAERAKKPKEVKKPEKRKKAQPTPEVRGPTKVGDRSEEVKESRLKGIRERIIATKRFFRRKGG